MNTTSSSINIAVIVEGHGEMSAIRGLLQRICQELLGGVYADVSELIRRPRSSLLKWDDPALEKAVDFAARKLKARGGGLVLLLVDAEGDCNPGQPKLGPTLLNRAKAARSDADVCCVIANVMFETWFVAAADSLRRYLTLPEADQLPIDPETNRMGKAWIKKHSTNGKYEPQPDQARLASEMDLNLCRSRSPPFDKLCRELAKRMPAAADATSA